jgi:hypothetical protein
MCLFHNRPGFFYRWLELLYCADVATIDVIQKWAPSAAVCQVRDGIDL